VDDDRSRDHGDAAARRFGLAHHRRDSHDTDLDPPFRRDLVRHERKPEAIARLELRHDLDTPDAAHDRISPPQVAEFSGRRAYIGRTGRHRWLDHDGGVHPLPVDENPFPLNTHERLVIGGGVEVVRGAAVPICRDEVDVVGACDTAAERDELFEQLCEIR
jgi:hypothetical protein